MFEHVLFDLDGTLTDSTACIVASMAGAMEAHGFAAPARERVVALMGVPLEKSVGMLDARAGAVAPDVIATYRRVYAERAPELVRAFAGVPALLELLVARGVRSAVVTSKHTRPAEADCAGVGIRRHLALVVGSDQVDNHKPHPEPALHALKLMGARASGAVVVGDSTFDIEMGRAAGVRTIGVAWGAHPVEKLEAAGAERVVRSVGELSRALGME